MILHLTSLNSIYLKKVDMINSLKMKYGKSIEDILSVLDDKKQKLSEYENYDEVVAARKAEYDRAYKKTYECGFSFKQPEKENSTKFFRRI